METFQKMTARTKSKLVKQAKAKPSITFEDLKKSVYYPGFYSAQVQNILHLVQERRQTLQNMSKDSPAIFPYRVNCLDKTKIYNFLILIIKLMFCANPKAYTIITRYTE